MKHADKKVFLHPGEFCFLNNAAHVHTILGSCISITLWHPGLRIGGMCHFTLPKHPHHKHHLGKDESAKLDGRYADDVIKMFLITHKLPQPYRKSVL